MKPWVKKLSYFVTGAAFILGGFLTGRMDVSDWWPGAMLIVGFILETVGGWFVQPEQP